MLSVYSDAKIGFAETLARVAQELAFNRLEVVLADGFQQGDNVDFGEIFGDSVALSTLTADSITVKDSSGNRVEEFKVSTDSEGHITGITDIVAVPDEVMESLEVYLSMRTDRFTLESPLFVNLVRGRTPERILKATISGIVKARLRSIGIDDPKISAHSLRHTCGSLMVEEGMSVETIQDMLGHNDPSTTQIYIDMARQKRLLEHSPSETIAKIISAKREKEQQERDSVV